MSKKKIAATFCYGGSMVQTLDTGRVMERYLAEADGYEVRDDLDAGTGRTREAPPQRVDGAKIKASVWRQEIMASPEAKGRDSAVAEILVKHNPETLSADAARAFLRGLPREQSERKEPTMTQNNVDPRAARKAELAASMRDFNRERGHASRGHASRGTKPSATNLASIDPVKLKRKAEIRLNALEMGYAQDLQGNATTRNETTKLRYALQVHGQTGKPLAEVFEQLGVDTSRIVR